MMKAVDPSIELVVCGSCGIEMKTYMEWDLKVLDHVGMLADYVSLHRYVGNKTNSTEDYLAVTNSIDQQIEEMDAVCRYVQARNRHSLRPYLCFDEWNIWYKNREMDGEGKFAPHLIEEIYNLEDALVAAGFLNSFIRHADVVKIANLAQIVNVIAPLQTRGDDLLLQTIYHPFEMYARRREGTSLRVISKGPEFFSPSYGITKTVDSSAVLNGEKLHVFATNRSSTESTGVVVELADGQLTSLESGELLTGPSPDAANSFEHPDVIFPQSFDQITFTNGTAVFELPPLSLVALTFQR